MATYLQHCRNVIDELDVGGGSSAFPGVTSATGEFANIARYINQAYLDTCNQFIDWRFLWKQYQERLPAGVYVAPSPSVVDGVTYSVRHWKRHSVWLDQLTNDAQQLQYIPWDQWPGFARARARPTEKPSYFTIRPDNVIEFDTVNNALRQLHAEYYCRPTPMANNYDIPLIPENHCRIIEVRAKIYYGEREDAPEIIAGAGAELDILMPRLESEQLDDWQPQTMGRPDAEQITASFDR